ncbi:MAG: DUF819 family protein [Rikenellaceae bacterium]|nr:DUF819 family protein [Rikenellaceae bacterium]
MIAKLLLVIFYLLAPAGVLWATRKFDLLRRLGPVLTLYILGVVVANIGIFPSDPEAHKSFLDFQESVSEILVPLALPMMLFGCNFKRFSVGKSLSAFIVGVVSVAAIVVVSYLMFAEELGAESPKMAAALAGQYTGGAANLAAVKQMVGLSTESFVMLSTCNLIVSFFYLMFLMGGGVTIARKIVGRNNHIDQEVVVDKSDDNPYRDFAKRSSVIQLLKVLAASVVIMGVSVVVGTVAGGESGISMVALILTITTLSLLMTASKQVRSWDKSYDAGMYLIYVFCLVMATMADLSSINWEQSLFVLMFQAVIIFGSLFVTIFAARPLRIDADTAVITSNTLINSPVCVPMIAATMKNRDVVVVGITTGLAGYAVGNYLGYLIYQLLQTM